MVMVSVYHILISSWVYMVDNQSYSIPFDGLRPPVILLMTVSQVLLCPPGSLTVRRFGSVGSFGPLGLIVQSPPAWGYNATTSNSKTRQTRRLEEISSNSKNTSIHDPPWSCQFRHKPTLCGSWQEHSEYPYLSCKILYKLCA